MASLIATEGGSSKEFQNAPQGVHMARCYRIIDYGTQQYEFKGKRKEGRKIFIQWELCGTQNDEGKPFSIGKKYTLSLGEKANLRSDLEAWRGRKFTAAELEGFDIAKLLNAPCMMNVVHENKGDKTYANIASVMPLAGGMVAPQLTNKPVLFTLSDFDEDVYNTLSDSMKKAIAESPEYRDAVGKQYGKEQTASGQSDLDDDIPF